MKFIKGTLAYVVCTFVVQATSHFGINREHYAAVTFLRPEPIFALGLLSMFLQGVLLTYLYLRHTSPAVGWKRGWLFGLASGAFFVSYSVLAEPAKYPVPSVPSWMLVEAGAGFFQFSLFGLALGWLYPLPADHRQAGADSKGS
jgi:hypothetical protein